ncbi:sensor histidine kinase [Daejeonella lutea]|nr:sensor histidine kinase [Daejeonella lutea]
MTGSIQNVDGLTVNYVLNISLFYFNAYIILDYFGERLKISWLLIGGIVLLEIFVFVLIKYPLNLLIIGDRIRLNTSVEYRAYAMSNILRSFYYVLFSTAYWFSIITVQRNKKIIELESLRLVQENDKIRLQKDLLSARNAYLQSQVNPHFLFNTLNFMYNSSMKVSEKLSTSILTLSDIMRYALTRIDEDQKVLLRNEIEHIKNFIDLNQVRFDQQLSIDFRVNGRVGDSRIIPLSLITIVENMFKYGDLLDPEYPASLVITLHENELEVEASNKKRAGRIVPGHGTGLKNLRERLDIYYADAYGLEIEDTDTQYKLKLTVILT